MLRQLPAQLLRKCPYPDQNRPSSHLLHLLLEAHQVVTKQGAIIDASITPTPRKPKGPKVYELTQEGTPPLKLSTQPGVDTEGSWVKKGGKLQYGYKGHYLCDQQAGLVLSVSTTTAKDHESKHMGHVVKQANLPPGSAVLADKGYASCANEE